ncbi:MAG: acyl-CoA dehydrogenase family protein [Planctomycetota bacterium]
MAAFSMDLRERVIAATTKAPGVIAGLKAEGVEPALRAAMRAHGGMGYSGEVDLGDRVRDLMGLRIADGTTDVMRMDVVRQAYGDEFWNMAVKPQK